MAPQAAQTFGYMRVSSTDQNEDRQRRALADAAVPQEHLYLDRQFGKDFQRPQYQRLVKHLRAGDLLCVPSIDRLGRNYDEVLEEWRRITKVKRADVVVLDMPLLDTRGSSIQGITGVFISDLVLQLLSYVAQLEREHIRERQRQGIDAALARGVRFGRPPHPRPEGYSEVAQLVREGEISQRGGAAQLEVSVSTFRRWLAADQCSEERCA